MSAALRILLVEDDPRFRRSLELLLTHTPGLEVAAICATAEEALALAADGAPPRWDLVTLDIELPGMSGVEAVRRFKALAPTIPVVMLTVFEDPRAILEAICAGADGYLVKRAPAGELIAQLRAAAAGGAPLTPGVARTVLDLVRTGQATIGEAPSPRRLTLTEREQEVLRLLVRGLAYKEAAAEIGVSLDTIRSHVKAIYRKLQVHSVAAAVRRALEDRLV